MSSCFYHETGTVANATSTYINKIWSRRLFALAHLYLKLVAHLKLQHIVVYFWAVERRCLNVIFSVLSVGLLSLVLLLAYPCLRSFILWISQYHIFLSSSPNLCRACLTTNVKFTSVVYYETIFSLLLLHTFGCRSTICFSLSSWNTSAAN
jgi:hypothetical protein